jgi:hypothetical protein
MVYGIATGKVASGTGGVAPTVTVSGVEIEEAKLPLATYVATTLSAPRGRNALNVAAPFVSMPEPSVTDVVDGGIV